MRIDSDAPKWVEKFHALPREERIVEIEKKKEYIEKITPKIVKFFEVKYGNSLDRIDVGETRTYYGSESHSMNQVEYKFYFNNIDDKTFGYQIILKKQVKKDLSDFFNIDVEYYGVPLVLEFFVKTWQAF